MPRFLVPKKSPQHRVASIALYRALLTQCSAVPLDEEERKALRNITRNRFRANSGLQSPRLLTFAFNAGYEALDLLDSSTTGDVNSTARVKSLLSEVPRRFTRRLGTPPAPSKKPKSEAPSGTGIKSPTLVDRPRPVVSGVRRIPKLVSANGIPFLRFKKPQPASLSRVITQMHKSRQKLYSLKQTCEEYWLPLASYEDQWDELLRNEFHTPPEPEETTWVQGYRDMLVEDNERHFGRKLKDVEMARRMQEIIDQETELANKEKQARREEKTRQKKMQKLSKQPGN